MSQAQGTNTPTRSKPGTATSPTTVASMSSSPSAAGSTPVDAATLLGSHGNAHEFFQALLSPDTAVRQQAEGHYASLARRSKLQLLLHYVTTATAEASSAAGQEMEARRMLALTLLRREVSRLGGKQDLQDANEAEVVSNEELASAVPPLLSLYFSPHFQLQGVDGDAAVVVPQYVKMTAHVLAEVCLVLSTRCNTDAVALQCMTQLLQTTAANLQGQQDCANLRRALILLGTVCQVAPVAFYTAATMPQEARLQESFLGRLPGWIHQAMTSQTSQTDQDLQLYAVLDWTTCAWNIVSCTYTVEQAMVASAGGGVSEAMLSLQSLARTLGVDTSAHSPSAVSGDPQAFVMTHHVASTMLHPALDQLHQLLLSPEKALLWSGSHRHVQRRVQALTQLLQTSVEALDTCAMAPLAILLGVHGSQESSVTTKTNLTMAELLKGFLIQLAVAGFASTTVLLSSKDKTENQATTVWGLHDEKDTYISLSVMSLEALMTLLTHAPALWNTMSAGEEGWAALQQFLVLKPTPGKQEEEMRELCGRFGFGGGDGGAVLGILCRFLMDLVACEEDAEEEEDDDDEGSLPLPPASFTTAMTSSSQESYESATPWDEDDEYVPRVEGLLQSMVSLSSSAGAGGTVVPLLMQAVQVLLVVVAHANTKGEWKHWRAALAMLRTCHDACHTSFLQQQQGGTLKTSTLAAVFGPFAGDAIRAAVQFSKPGFHVRVRYEACLLLCSLLSQAQDDDQEDPVVEGVWREVSQEALQNLLAMLQRPPTTGGGRHARMTSIACSALIAYCLYTRRREDSEEQGRYNTMLRPYLSTIAASLCDGEGAPLGPLLTWLSQQPSPSTPGSPANVPSPGPTASLGGCHAAVVIRALHVFSSLAFAMGSGDDGADASSDLVPLYPAMAGQVARPLLLLPPQMAVTALGWSAGTAAVVRGAALELFTTAACVVGAAEATDGSVGGTPSIKERAKSDVVSLMDHVVMPALVSLHQNHGKSTQEGGNSPAGSDIASDQLLTSCARFVDVLGAETFEPYWREVVMPYLLMVAQDKAQVSVTEGDATTTATATTEEEDMAGVESVVVSLPGITGGAMKFTVNTHQMQEKAHVSRVTYAIAQSMGASFGPYAEVFASAFLPLVNFEYSAEVRSTSAQALGPIFASACETAKTGASSNIPQQLFPPTMEALSRKMGENAATTSGMTIEDDLEHRFALADALKTISSDAFHHKCAALSVEQAEVVITRILQGMVGCIQRRAEIQNGEPQVQYVGMETHKVLDMESEILSALVDTLGYTIKSLREGFVPLFERLVGPAMQHFLSTAGAGGDCQAQMAAACAFIDCVEHCGAEAAARYSPVLAQSVVELVTAMAASLEGKQPVSMPEGEEDDLVTTAVYGISQVARLAQSSVWAPFSGEGLVSALRALFRCTSSPDEEGERSALAENAISALATLVLFSNAPMKGAVSATDRDALLKDFLMCMPIRQDDSEAQKCLDEMCTMIEKGTLDVFTTRPYTLQMTKIIVNTLQLVSEEGEEVATEDTCRRLVDIWRQMKQRVSQDVMKDAFESLTGEERLYFQRCGM